MAMYGLSFREYACGYTIFPVKITWKLWKISEYSVLNFSSNINLVIHFIEPIDGRFSDSFNIDLAPQSFPLTSMKFLPRLSLSLYPNLNLLPPLGERASAGSYSAETCVCVCVSVCVHVGVSVLAQGPGNACWFSPWALSHLDLSQLLLFFLFA